MVNDSEKLLSAISELYFYKELVQSNLHFTLQGSTEKEVADLLINLGDIIIAFQLKARNEEDQTLDFQKELKWLTSKCKKAKRQVKESINYIRSGQLPSFENGRKKPVALAAEAEIIPLVVFMNEIIEDDYPHILCRHSEDGMDINCISFDAFRNICRVLLTPMEIVQYFYWRLAFYLQDGKTNLPIETMYEEDLLYKFIVEKYAYEEDGIRKFYATTFSDMLQKLPSRVVIESEKHSSYPLILFFAHFNRIEIKAYVERISKTLNAAKMGQYGIIGSLRNIEQKYVIIFTSTHDGYALDMDFLDEEARNKGDFDILLQVFCYWESKEDFRIDFCFKDKGDRYLKEFT